MSLPPGSAPSSGNSFPGLMSYESRKAVKNIWITPLLQIGGRLLLFPPKKSRGFCSFRVASCIIRFTPRAPRKLCQKWRNNFRAAKPAQITAFAIGHQRKEMAQSSTFQPWHRRRLPAFYRTRFIAFDKSGLRLVFLTDEKGAFNVARGESITPGAFVQIRRRGLALKVLSCGCQVGAIFVAEELAVCKTHLNRHFAPEPLRSNLCQRLVTGRRRVKEGIAHVFDCLLITQLGARLRGKPDLARNFHYEQTAAVIF